MDKFKFDTLQRIKDNRTMPRQIRRNYWRLLCKHEMPMTWREYKELEGDNNGND